MSHLLLRTSKAYWWLGLLLLLTTTELIAQQTVIKVNPATHSGRINPGIYGVNQRWFDYDISLWEPKKGEESPLIKKYTDIGFRSLRYPAGTAADVFFWKRTIGPRAKRSKVIEGHTWEGKRKAAGGDGGGGGEAMTVDFGLDEALRFCEKTGSTFIYMYNFGTGSASDAADLVEYVNAPLGTNPNGGVAWAQVRAHNGHAKPYGVKYFEMGNEMYIGGKQHFWLEGKSKHSHTYKYCFGDTVRFTRQLVGEFDAQSTLAAQSNYGANQVKYLRYAPILPGTDSLYVGNIPWKRVDNLRNYGAENVYVLDTYTGKLTFGDGVHGNIPLCRDSIATIRASYTSVRDGYDDYYRAMKAVDPTVRVYSCLIDRDFIQHMGASSPYDGVSIHPYAGFWNMPVEASLDNYHDLILSNSDEEADSARHTLELIRKTVSPQRKDSVDVLFTEYGIALRDITQGYGVSLDEALYGARLVMAAIDLNMTLTSKHALGGLIGLAPHFVTSPTGYMYKMFTHMYGPLRISCAITGNPARPIVPNPYFERIHKGRSTLPKLYASASKDADGNVYLMVLNRDREDAVAASIELAKYNLPNSQATVWTLNGPAYTSYNTVENPGNVTIKESTVPVAGKAFKYTFPAHSITAIRLKGKIRQ